MGSHKTTVVPTETQEFYGSCTCRWVTMKHYSTAQEAEDEIIKHLAVVEKTRAYTRRMPPSLKESRDYYRRMADDPSTPEDVRPLWAQLANELDKRLNDGPTPYEGQSRLW